MEIILKSSFNNDLKKINDKELLIKVYDTIKNIEEAKRFRDISHFTRLRGFRNHFRIQIVNYRIGGEICDGTIYLARFLHMKEIYKYFP